MPASSSSPTEKANDRNVLRRDALVAEFLVERHVGVAVDGRYHGRLLAAEANFLMSDDDRLPVGMAERRVVDHDVFVRHALGLEVSLAGSCWWCADRHSRFRQHPALRRIRRLRSSDSPRPGSPAGSARRRCRTRSVSSPRPRTDGVEQQPVELLDHRQNRLAADRGPGCRTPHRLCGRSEARASFRQTTASWRPGRRPPPRLLAEQAAFLFRSSTSISMVSFSVVSADGHGPGK